MRKLTIAAIALIVMASCEKSEIVPMEEDAKEMYDRVEQPKLKYSERE